DAGILPLARNWRVGDGSANSPRRARIAACGPPDLGPVAPLQGFLATGSDGGRTSSSSRSRLHRSGDLCLARSLRPVLRPLDRAGALPRAMWDRWAQPARVAPGRAALPTTARG